MPILSAVRHLTELSDVCGHLQYRYIPSPSPALEAPATRSYCLPNRSLDLELAKHGSQQKDLDIMAVSCAQTRSLGKSGNSGTGRQQGSLCNERWVMLSKDTFQEIFEKSIDELICINEPPSQENDVTDTSAGGRTGDDVDAKLDGVNPLSPIVEGGGNDRDVSLLSNNDPEKGGEGVRSPRSVSASPTLENNSPREGSPVCKDNSKSSAHRKTHRQARSQSKKGCTASRAATTTEPGDTTRNTNRKTCATEATATRNQSVVGSTGSDTSRLNNSHLHTSTGESRNSSLPLLAIPAVPATRSEVKEGYANREACVELPLKKPTPEMIKSPPPTRPVEANAAASFTKARPMECAGSGSSAQSSGKLESSELEIHSRRNNKNPKRPSRGDRKKREGEGRRQSNNNPKPRKTNNNNNSNAPKRGSSGNSNYYDVVNNTSTVITGLIAGGSTSTRRQADIDELADRDQFKDLSRSDSVVRPDSGSDSGCNQRLTVDSVQGCRDPRGLDPDVDSGAVLQVTDLSVKGGSFAGCTGGNSLGTVSARPEKDIRYQKPRNEGRSENGSCGEEENGVICKKSVTNQATLSSPSGGVPGKNTENHTAVDGRDLLLLLNPKGSTEVVRRKGNPVTTELSSGELQENHPFTISPPCGRATPGDLFVGGGRYPVSVASSHAGDTDSGTIPTSAQSGHPTSPPPPCTSEHLVGGVDKKNSRNTLLLSGGVPGDLIEEKKDLSRGERRGDSGEKTQVLLLGGGGDQATVGIEEVKYRGVSGGFYLQGETSDERLVDVVGTTQQDLVGGPQAFVDVSSHLAQGPAVSKDLRQGYSLKNTRSYIHCVGGDYDRSECQSSGNIPNVEQNEYGECDLTRGLCGVTRSVKRVNNNDYNVELFRSNTVSENAMSDSSMRVFSGNKMNANSFMTGSKRKLMKEDNINWISVNKADVVNLVNEIVFEDYADSSSGNEHGYSDDNTAVQWVPTSNSGLPASEARISRRGELPVEAGLYDKNIGTDQQKPGMDNAGDPVKEDGPMDLSQPTEKSQTVAARCIDSSRLPGNASEGNYFDPRFLSQTLLFREGALVSKSQETRKDQPHPNSKSAAKKDHSKNSNNNQSYSKENSKQCWVAFNKDMVLNIVDTAYDSVDTELRCESPKSPLRNHTHNNEYVFVSGNSEIAIQRYGGENRLRQLHSQSDKDSDIDVETVDSDLNPDENIYPGVSSSYSLQNYKDPYYIRSRESVPHSEGLAGPPSRMAGSKNQHRKKGKEHSDQLVSIRKRKRNVARDRSVSPSNELIQDFEELSSSSPKRNCSPTETGEDRSGSNQGGSEGGKNREGYYAAPLAPSSENVVMSLHSKGMSSRYTTCADDPNVPNVSGEKSLTGTADSLGNKGLLYSLMLDKALQSQQGVPVPGLDQYRVIRGGGQPQATHISDLPPAAPSSQSTHQPTRLTMANVHNSIPSALSYTCTNETVPLRSPPQQATTETNQEGYHNDRETREREESQFSPSSKTNADTDVKNSRGSPKLGWVAVSKEEVQTIVASVMNEMISTEVCSPRDNTSSCASPMSQISEGSSRHSQRLLTYPSPSGREGQTPSPGSLSTNSGPQEDANLPEDETRSVEGSAHTPNSTCSSRGFKWKTSLLKRAREEDEDQLSSDSVSDLSHDDLASSHDNELLDQSTSHRRSRRSKRKT